MTARPGRLSEKSEKTVRCDDDTSFLTTTAVRVYISPARMPNMHVTRAGTMKTGMMELTAPVCTRRRQNCSEKTRRTRLMVLSSDVMSREKRLTMRPTGMSKKKDSGAAIIEKKNKTRRRSAANQAPFVYERMTAASASSSVVHMAA